METTRYEKFTNKEVQDLLESKATIIEEGNKLVDEYKELEAELEKKNQQVQKIKDQLRPLVDPYIAGFNLGEFEVPTEVKVVDGEIEVSIVDQIESYKELLREKKEKELTKEDGTKTDIDTDKESAKGTA